MRQRHHRAAVLVDEAGEPGQQVGVAVGLLVEAHRADIRAFPGLIILIELFVGLAHHDAQRAGRPGRDPKLGLNGLIPAHTARALGRPPPELRPHLFASGLERRRAHPHARGAERDHRLGEPVASEPHPHPLDPAARLVDVRVEPGRLGYTPHREPFALACSIAPEDGRQPR